MSTRTTLDKLYMVFEMYDRVLCRVSQTCTWPI